MLPRFSGLASPVTPAGHSNTSQTSKDSIDCLEPWW
jgi:hypothetical protein